MAPEQLDFHMQKNEVGPLHHTIYKINSIWINNLNKKNYNHNTLRRKQKILTSIWQWLLSYNIENTANIQTGLHQNIKLLYIKRYYQQSKKRMGENIYKSYLIRV